MKPLLIVDWHDVLEDYTTPFLEFLKTKNIFIDVNSITKNFIFMGVSHEHFVAFEENLGDLEILPGAREAIEKLSQRYRIICVSASKAVERYQFQLKFKYPHIEKFLYAEPKNVIIHELGASVFIDDQIPHLEKVECRKIAFSKPWNKDWQGERGNWEEILCLI